MLSDLPHKRLPLGKTPQNWYYCSLRLAFVLSNMAWMYASPLSEEDLPNAFTSAADDVSPINRIYEVGIGYFGRTYVEGKKIGWKDGMWAIWCILKYNLRR